jgi:hypothetical protein
MNERWETVLINAKRIAVGFTSLSILAAAVVGATSLSINPAEAAVQSGYYIYEFSYYSDSSQTTLVGGARQGCYPGDPAMYSWGDVTPYYSSTVIGQAYPDGTCILY